MARSERHEDGTRAAVGTIAPPRRRPRPDQGPEAAPAPRPGRQGRPAGPQPTPAGRAVGGQPVSGRPAVTVPRLDASLRTGGPRGQRVPAPAPAAKRPAAKRPTGPQAVAAPARPGTRPDAAAPWRVPPATRTTGPQPAIRTTGPQPAIRTTGPQPATRTTGPQPAEVRPQPAEARPQPGLAAAAGSHRMPFVLLLCGLLGGALISALVISTTLAEGSFQISKLQDSTSALARQRQVLQEEVAEAQSAQTIETKAAALGMRRVAELRFLDLATGKTTNDGPTWSGAVDAPGYAP
jgi:hypothetical protein